MKCRLSELSEAEIQERLHFANRLPRPDPILEYPGLPDAAFGQPRKAAVLLPLIPHRDGWHLLLTRRNSKLPEHSGQVAFPGGRSESGEASPEQTALREAYEEVGIAPQDVRLLGSLNDYWTISNYWVTPVVGTLPWPYPLRLARDEVARAFTIPLKWLADPKNYELRLQEMPIPLPPAQVVYYKTYRGELLWGASARFVLALIHVLNKNLTVGYTPYSINEP